jgi:hypothetical protein
LIVAVVAFDLGPPLAFNDDHVYAFMARQLALGHGLRTTGQSALTLPQGALGATVWRLGAHDQRVLRLLTLPFLLLAVAGCAVTAGLLGAPRRWQLLAGLVLMGSPIALALSTSFMSDVFYVGLLMLSVFACVRWLERDDSRSLAVIAVTLATLQRQVGAAVLVGMLLALGVAWRQGRRPGREDVLAIVSMAAGVVAALAISSVVVSGTVLMSGAPPNVPPEVWALVLTRKYADLAVYTVPVLGLLLLPFAAASVARLVSPRPTWRALLPPAALLVLAPIFASLAVLLATGSAFPGDYLSRYGLGPPHIPFVYPQAELGQPQPTLDKPSLLSPAAWTVIGAVSIASFSVLALLACRGARQLRMSPAWVLLLATGGIQLGLLGLAAHVDRYMFSAVAPLIPLVAVAASRAPYPGINSSIASLVLALFGLAYVAGERDYQAWEVARDRAARLAFARYGAAHVDAGYEANATYFVQPSYERTGKVPQSPPPAARAHLEFAPRNDPRPGFDYDSVAPGRVVIVEGPAAR